MCAQNKLHPRLKCIGMQIETMHTCFKLGVSCSESRAHINELTHESRLNWNKLATLPGVCAGCESHAHHPCKCALCADAQMCIKCTFLGNYLFRLIIKLLLCINMQLFLYRFTVLLVYLLPVHPIIQMQLLNVQC